MIGRSESLARELHDGIAQDLVAVGYSLDLLLANPATSQASRSQIRSIRFAVTELVDKVRKEIFLLGQDVDATLANRIEAAAQLSCSGLQLHLEIENDPEVLSPNVAYEIHRIAQEIFRNVAFHSKAEHLHVQLTYYPQQIVFSVTDDGVGGAQIKSEHFGIQGIQSRARNIEAELTIDSDSTGTRIQLRVPMREN